MENNELIQKKLDAIIDLLRNLLALELTKRGVSRGTIGKRLHVAKAAVVKMLEGIKTE